MKLMRQSSEFLSVDMNAKKKIKMLSRETKGGAAEHVGQNCVIARLFETRVTVRETFDYLNLLQKRFKFPKVKSVSRIYAIVR